MGSENCIYGDNYSMRTLYLWKHYGLTFTYRQNTMFGDNFGLAFIHRKNTVFIDAIMGWEHCILETLWAENTIYGDNKLWAKNAIYGDYHGLRTLFMETIMGWEHYIHGNNYGLRTGWEHCIHRDNSGQTSREHHISEIVTDSWSDDTVPTRAVGVKAAQRPVEARHQVLAITGEANTVSCHNFILCNKEQN